MEIRSQKSFLLSLEKSILLDQLKFNSEIVRINNFLGYRSKKALYRTLGASYYNRDWVLFASSVRRVIKHDKKDYKDMYFSYGLNYLIKKKYNIRISKVNVKENNVKGNIFEIGVSIKF
jgi:hypothetical protein